MKKQVEKILSFLMCAILAASAAACGRADPLSDARSASEENGGASAVPESSASSPTDETDKVDYSTFQSFWMKQSDYQTMPICAFNAFPSAEGAYTKDMYTEEYVKRLAEAGFNVGYARESANNPAYREIVAETLANCAKYDISYIAYVAGSDGYTDANILETAVYRSLIEDKPEALGGIIIRDEPSAALFPSVAKSVDTFREVFSSGRYKGLLYQINLFPDYATGEQLSGSAEKPYSYEEYVTEYLETVTPQVLSYDYYPCTGESPDMSEGYFGNMSLIREKAAEAGIPFWVYIQSCTWGGRERKPNQADNDWQVNTALAYGAKGLQYFAYVTPGLGGEDKFADGCISRDGERTDTYYYVRETNKQVAAVDEVLMCSLSRGVMVSGTTPCPIPNKDVLDSYGSVKSVSGGHVLLGCFCYLGKDAYYAVNNSVEESDEISLTFEGKHSGYIVSDGERTEFSDREKLVLSLNAGKGALIVLQK